MLNLSLICVFLRTEKSTLLVGCTRRYENRSGNVRMLLASWSESRLKPVGLASGVPGQVVALKVVLHGSLKATHTGCPLAPLITVEPLRNATKPLVLNHCASPCWSDGMVMSLKSPL